MNSNTIHTLAKQQYFELRIALNKSNKVKDLTSELEFVLRENDEEFFVIIKASQAEHGLQIASYLKKRTYWTMNANISYQDFYKYMFKKIYLININTNRDIDSELASWLSRLWVIQVKN
jgi:hypothetical protein